ncbi:hypothetical protein MBM_05484 [Drepanopeziza brunnea f. sp. 'multigermtubi' MB_m1]|uniref:Uncharacterized protein n=1 Tax=Marssonina brunnea f. sp. multigermtubi (strain MB_m1) TaxID=1072389 RepID=K1WFI3_MARBU|nr:uncharacterized protein MBM_05484 [Drepanopeziza brunnea f. sp. 'multigermtubi' MB_m1]EKD16190.1 hypothetical protein MBM_05484 [Drepanopeziza brunnea f. sp. 'multigermtubi' MB_m1]
MRSDLTSVALAALFASVIAGPIHEAKDSAQKRDTSYRDFLGFRRQLMSTVTVPAAEATCTPCVSGSVETVTVTETAIETLTVAGCGSGYGGLMTTVTQANPQTVTVVQSGTVIQPPLIQTVYVTAPAAPPPGPPASAEGLLTYSAAGPSVVTLTGPGGIQSVMSLTRGRNVVTVDNVASIPTSIYERPLKPSVVTVTAGSQTAVATLSEGPNVVAVGSGDRVIYVTVTRTEAAVPEASAPRNIATAGDVIDIGSGSGEAVKTLSQGKNMIPVTRGGVVSTIYITASAPQASAPAGGVVTLTQNGGSKVVQTLTEGPNVVTYAEGGRQPSVVTITVPAGPTPGYGNGGSSGSSGSCEHVSVTVNIVIYQFIHPGYIQTITQSAIGHNVTSIASSPPVTVTTTITLVEGASATALPGINNGTIISNNTMVLDDATVLNNGTVLSGSNPSYNETALYPNTTHPAVKPMLPGSNPSAPAYEMKPLPLHNETVSGTNGTNTGSNGTDVAINGPVPLDETTSSTTLTTTSPAYHPSATVTSSLSPSLATLSAASASVSSSASISSTRTADRNAGRASSSAASSSVSLPAKIYPMKSADLKAETAFPSATSRSVSPPASTSSPKTSARRNASTPSSYPAPAAAGISSTKKDNSSKLRTLSPPSPRSSSSATKAAPESPEQYAAVPFPAITGSSAQLEKI